MGADASARARALAHRLAPGRPVRAWRAPGRVNLVGEHIDYLGGIVLPFACNLDTILVAHRRADLVSLTSTDEPGSVDVWPDRPAPALGWGRYVDGVVRVLADAGFAVRGLQGIVSSDVPAGAGLSSSAALEAVVALAVTGGERAPPELLQRAEQAATGVPCGPMDQVAVLHGLKAHAVALDCSTGAWDRIRLPEGAGFVVVDTGTRRQLDDGRYARRRSEAEAAVRAASVALGVSGLRDLRSTDVERAAREMDEVQRRRLRHAVGEQDRVRDALEALRSADVPRLGSIVSASHASLRDDFEVSAPALEAAVEALVAQTACLGARLVGAGFAGCVLGVCERDAAAKVAAEAERRLGGGRAHVVEAADGAGEIAL